MAEQEAKVRLLFKQLEAGFKQLEKITDDAKSEKKLKELVELIKDVKGAVKEYEREAKVDGVDAAEIKATRSDMVNTVNKYVSMKKEYSNRSAARAELMAGPSKPAQVREEDMTNQEIMQAGRNKMKDIDDGLARAVRVVNDTEVVGAQAAQKLKAQTDQMNKIIDDLNEIDFTMQKASKVLRDITRGLLTDKCIMCLLFLVVAAIATAIGMKIAGVGNKSIRLPGTDRGQPPSPFAPPPPGPQGRRLLETPYDRFMTSRKMLVGPSNVAQLYK